MYDNKVASIMVTYNPDSDLTQNAKKISECCEQLIIIDNGSKAEALEYLKPLEGVTKITIVYNEKNMGLGFALNQGIRYILDSKQLQNVEWIATFDQDSKVQEDYFSNMLMSYGKHPNKDEVGILSPKWIEQKINQELVQLNDNLSLQEQITVITSGSLVKRNVFMDIGLFEEDYFIDFLDHEFCLRARSKGYKIFMIPNVTMVHNLGNMNQYKLLGSTVMATNHNYIRRYYISRNRIYTYRKFFWTEKEWIKGDIIATTKEFIIIFLFEKDRVRKLRSIIMGTFDAIRGKKGQGPF